MGHQQQSPRYRHPDIATEIDVVDPLTLKELARPIGQARSDDQASIRVHFCCEGACLGRQGLDIARPEGSFCFHKQSPFVRAGTKRPDGVGTAISPD